MLAHAGVRVSPLHVQRVHVLEVRADVLLRVREGLHPDRVGPFRDHVFDVREVLHMSYAKPRELQVPPNDVERNVRTRVAQMAVVVHGGAAHVHPDIPIPGALEGLFPTALRVVQLNRHRVEPA